GHLPTLACASVLSPESQSGIKTTLESTARRAPGKFSWQSVESGGSRSSKSEEAAGGGRRETREARMTRYLISCDVGWTKFAEEELPDVTKAAIAVVKEAQAAGVWVYGAGLESQRASIVATDGMVTDGPFPETKEVIGGFSIVDVS